MVYVNPSISQTKRVFPEQGRREFLRLDMNENVDGLPKDFVEEVRKEITSDFLSAYPEAIRFEEVYAGYLGNGAKKENVLSTNGSDMAIRYILETFGERGKDVVTVTPSFEMYRINCSLLGLRHKSVNYETDLTIDVQKILDAITEDTRIVVLLNPNNPIGNVYAEEEMRRIIEKAVEVEALVVIDEAYYYYYPNSFWELALCYEHVLVLRTFSKLFSMAACRLGVVIGSQRLLNEIRKMRVSFDVNSIALLFGERIIRRPDIIRELIRMEKEGKQYLLGELNKNGYEYLAGEGNYIFIRPKREPRDIERRLRGEGVLVHTLNHPLIQMYVRVSTASRPVMSRFMDCFLAIDNGEAGGPNDVDGSNMGDIGGQG